MGGAEVTFAVDASGVVKPQGAVPKALGGLPPVRRSHPTRLSPLALPPSPGGRRRRDARSPRFDNGGRPVRRCSSIDGRPRPRSLGQVNSGKKRRCYGSPTWFAIPKGDTMKVSSRFKIGRWQKGLTRGLFIGLALLVASVLVGFDGPTVQNEGVRPQAADSGKALFVKMKCTKCHSVKAAGVKRSEPLEEGDKESDLSKMGAKKWELDDMAKFLKKKAKRNGKKHRKKYKGSDDDLKAILTWLKTLK